ncbi:hypothetical protein DPMN_004945 [Dreissena polymorpha]|uniref:Uncharacterized protein n=1 Tax=Dreissena polymorpha TaxID=45954 RepID=A0A9D4MTL5_DREPO|nr:hypothetical protein DPMN_004945 [Dreissena polymorpha]
MGASIKCVTKQVVCATLRDASQAIHTRQSVNKHVITDGGVLIAPKTAVNVSMKTVTKPVEFAYCQSASRVINLLHCVTKNVRKAMIATRLVVIA